jgi:hypothetical protein
MMLELWLLKMGFFNDNDNLNTNLCLEICMPWVKRKNWVELITISALMEAMETSQTRVALGYMFCFQGIHIWIKHKIL